MQADKMSLWLYGLIGFGIVAAVAAGLWAVSGPLLRWGQTAERSIDLTDKVVSGVGGFIDKNWEDWKSTQKKAAETVGSGISKIGNAIGGVFTNLFDGFKNVISPPKGGGPTYSPVPQHLTPAVQNPKLAVETATLSYHQTSDPIASKAQFAPTKTGPRIMKPPDPPIQRSRNDVLSFFTGGRFNIF